MKKFLIAIFIVFFMFCLILMPKETSEGFLEGVKIWYFNLLPSLLPFFIFSKLFETLGVTEKMSKLFKKPFGFLFGGSDFGSYVFLMSLLSGYPVSQKIISDLYENGKISRGEASHMSVFTSNSGLLFVVGTTGIVIFGSLTIGATIFCCHVLASVAIGMIQNIAKNKKALRGSKRRILGGASTNSSNSFDMGREPPLSKMTSEPLTTRHQDPLVKNALNPLKMCNQVTSLEQRSNPLDADSDPSLTRVSPQPHIRASQDQELKVMQERATQQPHIHTSQDTISSSVSSIFLVGTYVALFSMVSSLLGHLGFFKIFGDNLFLTGIFQGILEMTKGILTLSTHSSLHLSVIVTGGLISFSGISILMQSLTFLGKCHVSKTKYILAKLTQGILTMAFLTLLFAIFPNFC